MSPVESAFGLTEEQRLAKEEEERNVALVEIQLRDEHSFPALGVSSNSDCVNLYDPNGDCHRSLLTKTLRRMIHYFCYFTKRTEATVCLQTQQEDFVSEIQDVLTCKCFPQTQPGLQGDGGKKKLGDKRKSQRNKTVSLFFAFLLILTKHKNFTSDE